MFYRAPAKIILSGEHSVVYGHKALCAAIQKHTTLKISQAQSQIEIKWGKDWHQIVDIYDNTTILGKVAQILQMKPSLIEVTSEVPSSSGLGSSAAFSVALTKALNGTIEQAIEIENIFHGKRGSGLDVQVCHNGGICVFQIGKPLQQIDMKLDNVLLIDSGDRKKSGTQGSIQKVKDCVDRGDGKQIIDRISQVTEQIIKDGIVKELIYENHDLLNRLGICTPNINRIIQLCKDENVPAKMTGAGDGGFCIAFPKDPDQAKYLIEKLKGFHTQITTIDYEGCVAI